MEGLAAAAARGDMPCWNGEAYICCGMWVSWRAELNELASGLVACAVGNEGNKAVVPENNASTSVAS